MNQKTLTAFLFAIAVIASVVAVQTFSYQYKAVQEAWAFSETNRLAAIGAMQEDTYDRNALIDKKGGGGGGGGGGNTKAPFISSINPSSGVWYAQTQIAGSNFGTQGNEISLIPTGASANATSISIEGVMPSGSVLLFGIPRATITNTDYAVKVTNAYGTSNSVVLRVLPPGVPPTGTKNTNFIDPTYAAGAIDVKIGSTLLTAQASEGSNITNLTVMMGNNATNFANMKVRIGGTQFGATRVALCNYCSHSFSGVLNIPAGQTKIVDIYADVLTSASGGSYVNLARIGGVVATGATSLYWVSAGLGATGHTIAIAGAPRIAVSRDSGQAASDHLAMGSTGNSLATFRFTETNNTDDVRITDLYVFQKVVPGSVAWTGQSAFSNLSLYNGSTLVGAAGFPTAHQSSGGPGYGYYYKFTFGTPITVPRANSVLLTLKGDVASYSSSGAMDNSKHVFTIATSTHAVNDTVQEVVVAYANTSNATSVINLSSPIGNEMTVLRTKLGFMARPSGLSLGRLKQTQDYLASLTFNADTAGSLSVNTVTVFFYGSGIASTTISMAQQFVDAAKLVDASANPLGSGQSQGSCQFSATSTGCTKVFSLGGGSGGYQISAGTSSTIYLVVDSTKTAVTQTGAELSASIYNQYGISWTDGLDIWATQFLPLAPRYVMPIYLNNVVYAPGS